MPEVTIKYKKPETLKILKGLAKYFDFKISSSTEKKKSSIGDILIPGNKTLDISELEKVFTGKDLDAKKLRDDLWQRKR